MKSNNAPMAAEGSPRKTKGAAVLRRVELGLLVLGYSLLGIFVAEHVDSAISSHATVRRFREIQGKDVAARTPAEDTISLRRRPENRKLEYGRSLAEHVSPPLAVLRIARLHLEVPVLDGTGKLALNRGVGHIRGTANPGEAGNTGIAGHRDGFFRLLRDVRLGDLIDLEKADRILQYRVTQILIVDPSYVELLQPKAVPSLTLITCYPFHLIGSAPKRYVVEAVIADLSNPDKLQTAKYTRIERSAQSLEAPENRQLEMRNYEQETKP